MQVRRRTPRGEGKGEGEEKGRKREESERFWIRNQRKRNPPESKRFGDPLGETLISGVRPPGRTSMGDESRLI